MADGSQVEDNLEGEGNESNIKVDITGQKEFRGSVEHRDPMAPTLTPAPDGVPEKFWDPVEGKLRQDDLIKSYQALESKLGKGKSDDDDGDDDTSKVDDDDDKGDDTDNADGDDKSDDKDDDKGDDANKDDEDASAAAVKSAIESAREAYAANGGELPEESREALRKAGITDDLIDYHLAGVKAAEAALYEKAYSEAGSADNYNSAVAWALTNWSDKQKMAFNAQMGDVETIGPAVAGLMAAFKKANPGEGSLIKTTSVSKGDVYEDEGDFQKDLAEADRLRDPVKRRKAIAKLRRSREAGVIK
jgi:hypothetical protein